MASYRQRLGDAPRLDGRKERELARRFAAGDQSAGDEIVIACLPFVIAIAVEYRRWGIPLEDVVQQGNVGLLKAARKFDPERDVRLATYAAYWIRAEIREMVVRGYRVVRIGTTKAERRALRAYRTSAARDVESLSTVSGLSRERVEQLLPVLAAGELSLDATFGDGERSYLDNVPANDPSPETSTADVEANALAREAVARGLVTLSERERLIVQERLMADEPTSLQALGDRLGVSKERVRQLEERAMKKLASELAPLRDVVGA